LLRSIHTKNIFTKDGIGALLDTTGVVVSWLCVVHCLVLPFTVALLPFAGLGVLLDETAEWGIVAASAVVAGVSLLPAFFRRHRKFRPVVLFASGLGLLLTARIAFEGDLVAQAVFLLTGALLITAAHIINRRLWRDCAMCTAEGNDDRTSRSKGGF
jgi:hypothetical protein